MKTRLLLFVLFFACRLAAQKVQLIVPQQPVPVGTAFQVQYVITNTTELAGVSTPSFENFRVASGPNRYKGNTMMDGKLQPVENITYTLVPLKTGRLVIGGLTANFKSGASQSSGDVNVNIVQPSKASYNTQTSYTDVNLYAPPSKTDLQRLVDENLFIKVRVNKKRCYVGEPVIATFTLYSRLQSTSEVMNAPSLYGFSVMDMLNIHESYQAIETINGKIFNTSILRQLQLYPEQAGQLVIDPMHLRNTIEFEDSINKTKTVVEKELHSEPVSVTVNPLPMEKPEGYTGAVGRFSVQARFDTAQVESGRQGKLFVSISGKGNFIQFTQPQISWPRGWDVFEPLVKDVISKNSGTLEGRRDYEFRFSPDSSGRYQMPPVTFSFFDTDSGKFKTISVGLAPVNVIAAAAKTASSAPSASTGSQGGSKWIWISVAVAAILILLVLTKKKKASVKNIEPVPQKKNFAAVISQLDFSDLSDKQACFEIGKVLSDISKEYPAMNAGNRKELESIRGECELMVYSSLNSDGKKEELKERMLKLIAQVES